MIRPSSLTGYFTRCALVAMLFVAGRGISAQSTVYEYTVPTGGYDALGNVINYSDTVNGDWSLQYDPLSRLSQAASTSGIFSGITLTEQYDAYGNRLAQQIASTGASSANVPQTIWTVYDTNGNQSCPFSGSNRICATNSSPSAVSGLPTDPSIGMTSGYDAAGNFVSDGVTYAKYDAEGRMCASYSTNGSGYTQYFYDAEGNRVAKATASSFVCPGTSPPAASAVTAKYLVGQAGEQITELDGQNNWVHTNVYAAGALLATYNPAGMHFPLTDPLGTIRMEVSGAGQVDQLCRNLPFGDGQNCSGPDATEQHFTGKERDTESGLDYFGARYYGSSMGRFMSPDPSGLNYADPTNPQSLNLYSYARNNPLTGTDPTGMAYCQWDDGTHDDSANTGVSGAVNSGTECTNAGGTWSHADGLNDDGSQMGSEQKPAFTVTATLNTATDQTSVSTSGPYYDPQVVYNYQVFAQVAQNTKPVYCVDASLSHGGNGTALLLDAAGVIIPEEGIAAAGIQYGISTASAANSIVNSDTTGRNLGAAGEMVAVANGVNSIESGAPAWAKAVPFVGNIVNGVAAAHDLASTYRAYKTCLIHP